eukprot:Trichotokara_eunicae@DN5612_c0_g2_i2.p2
MRKQSQKTCRCSAAFSQNFLFFEKNLHLLRLGLLVTETDLSFFFCRFGSTLLGFGKWNNQRESAEMALKYVSAYMLAAIGGNESPKKKDVKKILESVGVDVEDE